MRELVELPLLSLLSDHAVLRNIHRLLSNSWSTALLLLTALDLCLEFIRLHSCEWSYVLTGFRDSLPRLLCTSSDEILRRKLTSLNVTPVLQIDSMYQAATSLSLTGQLTRTWNHLRLTGNLRQPYTILLDSTSLKLLLTPCLDSICSYILAFVK